MIQEYSKRNNVEYKWVVRARYDQIFDSALTSKVFADYFFTLKGLDPRFHAASTADHAGFASENVIYTPIHANYGGVNDRFAIGSQKAMTIYADVHESQYRKHRCKSSEGWKGAWPTKPEVFTKCYLCSVGIRVVEVSAPSFLVREGGRKQMLTNGEGGLIGTVIGNRALGSWPSLNCTGHGVKKARHSSLFGKSRYRHKI
jgi:hypothetical protein